MGLLGRGVGACEGERVEMTTVSEVASTLIDIPRPELTAAEKLGLVSTLLVMSEKSDADTIPVSITTSKVTHQTKCNSRRSVSRLEVERETTTPCTALSDMPSETARVNLSASLSLDVSSLSLSM